MRSRRYTIRILDGTTRVLELTVPAWPALLAVCAVIVLPMLVGLGVAWKARSGAAALYTGYQALEIENANYRSATAALSGQIASLQAAITELGAASTLDPELAEAMDRLPALVKNRAMGGSTLPVPEASRPGPPAPPAPSNPGETFGLLRSLLDVLESRLHVVRDNVDRRNALAAATPSIWPAHGWLSSPMGRRTDPLTGAADYHSGLDIAGERGQPVYATGAGTVVEAGYQGGYGNLIVIDHGFGLLTRYGHLSAIDVEIGRRVERGDVIGRLGSTGRATGVHLHYEVLANGRLLNPLRLLTQPKPRDR